MFITILYLISFAFVIYTVYLVLNASNKSDFLNMIIIEVIFLVIGFLSAFYPYEAWELFVGWRYRALTGKSYSDAITPKLQRFDMFFGIVIMVVYGLCFAYSLIKLISL
jgi:hypothetical protein